MAVAETSTSAQTASLAAKGVSRKDSFTTTSFILPAVLIILFLSIFPLIISLYVSLSRLQFARGGIQLTFVGLNNYAKLLVGLDQSRFLGKFGTPNWFGWLVVALVVAAMFYWIAGYIRRGPV